MHSPNHCDVINCPRCGDDDRLNWRDSNFTWMVLQMDNNPLVAHSPSIVDTDDDTVAISVTHIVRADASEDGRNAALDAFIDHLDQLADFVRSLK